MLLAVFAGMGYGVYGLAVRKFMFGYHPVFAFGVIALYTGGTLVACMLAFARGHGAEVLDLGSSELWSLGLSAFFGIAIGHVLYYTAIDRMGVATTAGVLQLQPFIVSAFLWYLAISAFVGIAIGHILYYISIARIGIVITSGVLQLQPFLVSAASFFLFGETFQWWQWIAGIVAIGGAYLMLTSTGSGAKQIAMAASEGSD